MATAVDDLQALSTSDVYRFRTEPLYGAWSHRGNRITLSFERPKSGFYLTATREPDGNVSVYMPPFSPKVGDAVQWRLLDCFLEAVHVYGQIATVNPADLGLVIRDAGITTRAYVAPWGLERELTAGWIERGVTWFAPDADPSLPYTPYLELAVEPGTSNSQPTTTWVSRQVGVDTEFRSKSTLLTAKWNDVAGIRAHVQMMIEEPDNESFKSYRALMDGATLKKFANAQEMWAAYREKWEWAKPRSRRVPTHAFEIVEDLVDQWPSFEALASQRTAFGFGGPERRQGDLDSSSMARRNVAVSTGVCNWSGTTIGEVGQEGRSFHEKLARRLQQENLGVSVVAAWDEYLLTRDPMFVRENLRLMQCDEHPTDWSEPLSEIEVFDVNTGKWVDLS